jgi:membrane-associated phospholipid phosphatase
LRDLARSDGSLDFYHGLGWIAGSAALSFGAEPSRRWTDENGFDSGIQSGLRLDALGARRDADTASDWLVAFSVGVLPVAAIGTELARTRDCVESWDMFGEAFESFSLALFVSEAIKVASGRERPFGDRCAGDPPRDARCRDDDRNLSFPSGHATLAAAGAGISCRFALEARGVRAGARGAHRALRARHRLGADGGDPADLRRSPLGDRRARRLRRRRPDRRLRSLGPPRLAARREARCERPARGAGLRPALAREGRLGAQWTMVY